MKYSLKNKKYVKKSLKYRKKQNGGMPIINGHVIESGAKLVNADLSNGNLTGLNLTDCNLMYSNLQGTIFSSTVLSNVNLHGTKMQHTQFNNTIISNTCITNANLQFSDFNNSNLINCNLNLSNLNDSILFNANIINCSMQNTTMFNGNLANINALNTNFVTCDFRYSNLTYSKIINSNLEGSSFDNCNLSGADLSNSNISWASFIRSNIIGSTLNNCNVSYATFYNNDFTDVSLANVDLENCSGLFNNVYLIKGIPRSLPLGCVRYEFARGQENPNDLSTLDCTNFYEHNLQQISNDITRGIENTQKSLDTIMQFLNGLSELENILHILSEYGHILMQINPQPDQINPIDLYNEISIEIDQLRESADHHIRRAESQLDTSRDIRGRILTRNFESNIAKNQGCVIANEYINHLETTLENINQHILEMTRHILRREDVIAEYNDIIFIHDPHNIDPIDLRRPLENSGLYTNIIDDAVNIIEQTGQNENIQLHDENSIMHYCDTICQVFVNIRIKLYNLYNTNIGIYDEIDLVVARRQLADNYDEVDAQHVHNEFAKQKIFIPGIMSFFLRNIPDGEIDLDFSGNIIDFIREHMYSYIDGAVFPLEDPGMQLYNIDNIREKMRHIFERLSLQSSYNFNMVIVNDITIKNIIIAILKYVSHREKIFQSLYAYLWTDDTFNAYKPGSDAAASVSCIPGMIERIILNVKSASQVMLTLEEEHPLDDEYIRLVNIMFVPRDIMAVKSVLDKLCSKETLGLDKSGRLNLLKSAMLSEAKRQLIEVYNVPELNIENHLAYIDINNKIDTFLSLPDSAGARLDDTIADDDLLKMLLCSEYPELDDE